MRESGSDPHRQKRWQGQRRHGQRWHGQRRRRYAAAVLCLGTLTVATFGVYVAEQRAARAHGAAAAPGTGPGTGMSPGSLASQPAAYPLVAGSALHPTSSGTAAPTPVTVEATPRTPSPSANGSGSGDAAGGADSGGSAGAGGSGADTGIEAGSAQFAAVPTNPDSPAPSMTVSNPLTAVAFAGLSQVGAIFAYSGGTASSHYCTGSVVSSQTGDIVVTAAHCVYDSSSGTYLTGIAFVPGYHGGQQPYGAWTPSRILVPQQWVNSGDPDYDVAFLVVHQAGSNQRIEDVVGANQLGLNPDYNGMAQVVGYPATTEQPVTCTNFTKQLSVTQLEFDCPGFPDGTSGGPFLADVDQQTGRGTVVGVIGGYQTGGDTSDISYSVYFSSAVADLFDQAQAAG